MNRAEHRRKIMRHIFAICSEAGVDRSDRIELAKAILELGEGIESYNELEIADLEDILFALKGWRVVQELRLANGTMYVEARVLVEQQEELDGDAVEWARSVNVES